MSRARLRGRTLAGLAAGLAAFAATAALGVIRSHESRPALPLAPLATLGPLRPATVARTLGPEGAPLPDTAPLAQPRQLRNGEQIDGIACTNDPIVFHVHAHLSIVVRGSRRQVPAGIGIAQPYEIEPTPEGRFLTAAPCFMPLHTHAADGIVHVEAPVERTYTLGELFDIWGQPLSRRRVGPAHGHVTALFDGRVFTADPRRIPLLAHSEIELEVSRPIVTPDTITFPPGL